MKNCRGFTLLEVIISLGIVAVGILAVSRAITGFAGTTLTLEQRMVASWVASNRLESHRILKTTPVVGTTHGSEEMAGHVWYFSETTTTTADPNLFRLDIVVFIDRDETEEAGNMYGYLLNYGAVNQPIITGSFQRSTSFKASLGENLEPITPLKERHWIPAFAGMTKAQFTEITKVKLTVMAKVIGIRHCALMAFPAASSHLDSGHEHCSASISLFGFNNIEIASSQAPRNDELHGAMYET